MSSHVVENPFQVGQQVFWNYPHDDVPGVPGVVTIVKLPARVTIYSWVEIKTQQGELVDVALYDELQAIKQ